MKKQIANRIIDLSLELRNNFPESYALLEETPLLHSSSQEHLSQKDFKDYLQSIQLLLQQLKESNKEPST